MRAFEAPLTPPWTAEDAQWATREALRAEGEDAPPARFIARRATLGCARLAQRGITVPSAGPSGALASALAGAAFVVGLASESVASASRINILAPPLLALLAWNLAVYLVLLAGRLLRVRGARRAASAEGPLRRVWGAAMSRWVGWKARRHGRGAEAVARFVDGWGHAAAPLRTARVAAALHAAAAMLALGALSSLYARGLAFEYRAGWDSTFLSAPSVHALLTVVLGPASQLSGIALPDAADLERLRFSQGPGENAAPWIHLHAVTLALVVIVPRLLLAAAAAWRVRWLKRAMALPLDDAYFGPLWRSHAGHATAVQVRPYSYRLDPALRPGLEAALAQLFGSRVQVQLAEPVPQGAEDVPAAPAPAGALVVALFPLTATPEPETHGAFVRALARVRTEGVRVLVDESGFRRRFTGAEGETRRAQRRTAWERLLHDEGFEPWFADLAGNAEHAEPGGDAAWARRGGLAPR